LAKTQALGYLKLFYNVKIELFNAADVAVNVKSIDAKMFINGIQFADINSNLSTIVKAKSKNIINIAASVNTGNIIASIIDIISEGKATIKIEGTLLTDLGLIEFTKEKIV
jgi:LEA14-like dessication related protein